MLGLVGGIFIFAVRNVLVGFFVAAGFVLFTKVFGA